MASNDLEKKKTGECVLLCELSPFQQTLYSGLSELEEVKLVSDSQDPCTCHSGERQGYCCRVKNKRGQHWIDAVPQCIVLLLKCANHVALLLSLKSDTDTQVQHFLRRGFRRHPELVGLSHQASLLTLSSPQYCGKLKVLEKLLSRFISKGQKLLLYTHSHQVLVALEEFLLSQKSAFVKLNSASSHYSRQQTMDTFKGCSSTDFILLCTPGSSSDTLLSNDLPVLVYDPCFNNTRTQRCDWCSHESSTVYKLIAMGTIEEMLYIRSVAGCQGTPSRREEDSLFPYCDLFTLHSKSVSVGREDWQVTKKMIDGVCVSKLSRRSRREASTDSGIAEQTFNLQPPSSLSPQPPPTQASPPSPLPPLSESRLIDSIPLFDPSEDLRSPQRGESPTFSERCDFFDQSLIMPPVTSRIVTKKGVSPRKPGTSKKKKTVKKGLVYESENEEIVPPSKRPSNRHITSFSFKRPELAPVKNCSKLKSPSSFSTTLNSNVGNVLFDVPPQGKTSDLSQESTCLPTLNIGDSPDLFSSNSNPDSSSFNMDELFGI